MAKLTAVICFLNEREEVRRTVASIRQTAGSNVDILLINDASERDYDYEAVAKRFGCRYLEHRERVGPAVARSRGVDEIDTPWVLLLDAHMRFYAEDWWCRIEEALSYDSRAIYSMRCPPLNLAGERTGAPDGLGAWIHLEPDSRKSDPGARASSVLLPEWHNLRHASGPTKTVPCVLGGAYAFERNFFQEIGGHVGLKMYGGEEAFISAKAWLTGGSCQVLVDVEVGHIYRSGDEAPFVLASSFAAYNKMALLATVFPEDSFARYRDYMGPVPGYAEGVQIFRDNQRLLRNLRCHLHENVFRRPFAFFEALNRDFQSGGDIADRVGAAG